MNEKNENNFQLIEDFLSGDLSQEEERGFKNKLLTDSKLLEEYNFRIKIEKFWNEASIFQDTKDKVTQFFKKEKRKRTIWYATSLAASITIIFGLSIIFYPRYKNKDALNAINTTEKDTTSTTITPLHIDKQAEKGNLYSMQHVFRLNDTLYIQREVGFPETSEIVIIRIVDQKHIVQKKLLPELNSIFIPLSGIEPGEYQWLIIGTAFSGNFKIEDAVLDKK